jgi:small subunit ribosomal protein S6
MTNYEVMFIVKSTMEDEAIAKTAEDVKSLINGESTVTSFKDLGKKKLAYPINKEVSGNYYVMTVTASTDVIKEFDRKVRINENVIRHLILNLDEE